MPVSLEQREAILTVKILLVSLLIRIILSPVQGYSVDLSTFSAWFQTATEHGPHVFYEVTSFSDYPPFNVYIFWVFGSLAKSLSLFGKRSFIYILKLPPNLFDIATSALIFIFLRRKLHFEPSILTASLYAFNPATIFNTSIWGQFDAVYTFFLILTLLLILDSKIEYSVIAFTVGVLSKPQSIALAPLIAFLIAKEKGWKRVVTSGLISITTTLILIAPFKWSNPLDFLIDIYLTGYGGYQFTSLNAFNIWAFQGFWVPDSGRLGVLDFFTVGWLLFGALTVFSLYHLYKRLDEPLDIRVLFTAFVLLFGFFMLPTRIHERYLFPVFSVLSLTMPFIRHTKKIYGVLSLTYLANQAYVLFFLNRGEFIPSWDPIVLTVTSVNVVAFFFTLRRARLTCM
jgi:Gpi18-like mannosyltransferase